MNSTIICCKWGRNFYFIYLFILFFLLIYFFFFFNFFCFVSLANDSRNISQEVLT